MTYSNSTIAFAFDIDGVLMKGAKPVGGARETLKKLQDNKIPFIFLTNGGGLTEADHVRLLEQRLDLTLDPAQFIQSHTPYLDLVPEYHDKPILALGGSQQKIRNLAHAYGFKDVTTSSDIMAEDNTMHPFPEATEAYHAEHGWQRREDGRRFRDVQFAAVLVWSSPRDWILDQQLVVDLLLSERGFLGTRSAKNGDAGLPNRGYQQDGQPKLFFCNPDLEWATQCGQPRLAQGAFRASLLGYFAEKTKGQAVMQYVMCGKPTETTYLYAEKALVAHNAHLNAENGVSRVIDTVYMVGDNPESDIIGANSYTSRFGIEWKSVLVETGVHVSGTTPAYEPTHIAGDVKKAVEWALSQQDPDISEI